MYGDRSFELLRESLVITRKVGDIFTLTYAIGIVHSKHVKNVLIQIPMSFDDEPVFKAPNGSVCSV